MSDETKSGENDKKIINIVERMPKRNERKKKVIKLELLTKMILNEVIDHERIRFFELADGVSVPVSLPTPEERQECKILNDNIVIEYLRNLSEGLYEEVAQGYSNPEICILSDRNARQVLAHLKTSSAILRGKNAVKIKPFAFLSDPDLTFCRIPFDIIEGPEETPTWDLFFENLTNSVAVKAFIGSLFVPGSNRSQYLWIAGNGGNGKTTIANIISKAFGQFVRFERAPITRYGEDKFWAFGLLNKRLVVIDDCDRPEFVRSGLFKSITGTSKSRVEQKGCDAYDAEFTCKFFFTSNELPQLSSDTADQRRVILSTTKNVKPFPYDADFERRLMNELPWFISHCYEVYFDLCKDGRPIPTDSSEALEIADEFHEDVDVFIKDNFEVTLNKYDAVYVGEIIKRVKEAGLRKQDVYRRLVKLGANKYKRLDVERWVFGGVRVKF